MLTRDRAGYCEKHIAHAGDSVRKRNKMRRENDPIWREMYEQGQMEAFPSMAHKPESDLSASDRRSAMHEP